MHAGAFRLECSFGVEENRRLGACGLDAGNGGDEVGEDEGADGDDGDGESRDGRVGNDVERVREQVPERTAEDDAEGHADDDAERDGDAGLPCDGRGELPTGKAEGLEERELAPSATYGRDEGEAEGDDGAGRERDAEERRESFPWCGS